MVKLCVFACVCAASAGVIVNAVEFPAGLITAKTESISVVVIKALPIMG